MYLDQKQRRLIVLSRSCKPLATLHVLSKKQPIVLPGVRLVNKKGDVRLEQLRITRWNGVAPHAVQDNRARLYRTDGSIVYGRVVAFDPKAKTFTLRDAKTDTVVPQEAMADLFLAPQPVGKDAAKPGSPWPRRCSAWSIAMARASATGLRGSTVYTLHSPVPV